MAYVFLRSPLAPAFVFGNWWLNIAGLVGACLILSYAVLYVRHVLPFRIAHKTFAGGDYDGALRRLRLLEHMGMRSPSLVYFKGTILMFAGRYREAEQALRECIQAVQSSGPRHLGLVNLGYVLLELGRYDEAARSLDEVIKLQPHRAVPYSTRAEIYLRQGIEPERALALLDKGIQNKTGSEQQRRVDRHVLGYLFANRAWALFLLGRREEAEQALKSAEEGLQAALSDGVKPGAAGVHYHMARALFAGGETGRAREHFVAAAKTDPNGKYAKLADEALRGRE
ncbi:MAG TPA: tetratricopeptide repeat protein [Bryobacteraceae bacterium]|nr:tetratricopeptide repeat protein [Bryobacteraceae bacterium]